MRYLVALVVAALLIASVFANGYSLHCAVIAELQAEIRKFPDEDQTPESFLQKYHPDQFSYTWGPAVPSSVLRKLEIIDLLKRFSPQWAGLIIFSCLLTAWLFSPCKATVPDPER